VTSPANESLTAGHRPHVMPWWLGPLLVNPLRRLFMDPQALLGPLVSPGDTVLEIGPGYGFFTHFLAEAVGQNGRVVCVDVQPQMLRALERRLEDRGLRARVETRLCSETDLAIGDLDTSIDLVVAIHVVHEMSAPAAALSQMAGALRKGGQLFLMEPACHCPQDVFRAELACLEKAGLRRNDGAANGGARRQAAVFHRPPVIP